MFLPVIGFTESMRAGVAFEPGNLHLSTEGPRPGALQSRPSLWMVTCHFVADH